MSIPDTESSPSFEYFCIQYSRQTTPYHTEPSLTGPIFHRDSFDIYQENRARKNKGRPIIRLDDDSEGNEEIEENSPLNQLISRARQVWSTLPWSAAARERRKNRSRSSSDVSSDKEMYSGSDKHGSKSKSRKSKHARFASGY